MTFSHILGYPRIGADRELKRATEAYWKGDADRASLEASGRELRKRHWQDQREAGLDLVTVGDFAFYDQVLNVSLLLGAVPARFAAKAELERGEVDLDTAFRMARGRAPSGEPAAACEMTKYFDTNYHYLVPELHQGQDFRLASTRLFDEVVEAQQQGHTVKVALVGPLTWLWLGKQRGESSFDRLALLDGVLAVYAEVFARLAKLGVEWVQLDEPALAQDLPGDWKVAFERAYHHLQGSGVKLLVANYFGGLGDNLTLAVNLPVAGLHLDAVRAPRRSRRWSTVCCLTRCCRWGSSTDATSGALTWLPCAISGPTPPAAWASVCGSPPVVRCCMCRWTWSARPSSTPSSEAGWPSPARSSTRP